MIITIDGPAGTGKSTVAKMLAKKLKFEYFDTGAIYRAATWFILNIKCSEEEKTIEKYLKNFHLKIDTTEDGEKLYFVNGQDVTIPIRQKKITDRVSLFAAMKCVRAKLIHIQREFANKKNIVFEGRDMATVVFPKAQLKIFLTADSKIRAMRRFKEWSSALKGEERKNLTEEDVLKEIEERDLQDSSRTISPLKCAEEAYIIDTSDLTVSEVVNKIIDRKEEKTV